MRFKKLRLYLSAARRDTWESWGKLAESVMTAIAAAVAAAFLVAIGLVEHSSRGEQFALVLVGGLVMIPIGIGLTFLINLLFRARRRVRDQNVIPAMPSNVIAQVGIFTFAGTKSADVMQFEASVLAEMIEVRLRGEPGSRTMSPADADKILGRIWHFGKRAQSDEWITKKSRERSLALHREMLALAAVGEFEVIHQKCRYFVEKLQPSL